MRHAPSADAAATEAAIAIREGLGKALAEELKRHDKPWGTLTEDQQQATLDRLDTAVTDLVADAVDDIGSRGAPHVRLNLAKVEFAGGGVKVAGTASKHTARIHDLADLAGEDVMLVMVDANRWLEGAWPTPARDQGELELEHDGGWKPQQGDHVVITDPEDEHHGVHGLVEAVGQGLVMFELDPVFANIPDAALEVPVRAVGPYKPPREDWPEAGDVVVFGEADQHGTVLDVDGETAHVETEVDGVTSQAFIDVAKLRPLEVTS